MKFITHGYRRIIILLLAVFSLLLIESDAYARRYFAVTRPEIGYKFYFDYGKEQRTTPDSDRSTETFNYSESISLSTRGYAYHPALLGYRLKYSPLWRQHIDKSFSGSKSKRDSFFNAYFVTAEILKDKPYRLNIIASRNTARNTSNLGRVTETVSDSYSSVLSLKNEVLPTRIRYSHSERERKGFFASESDYDNFEISMDYRRHMGKSRLVASSNMLRSNSASVFLKTEENKMSFTNAYGIARNINLNSAWNYRSYKGGLNRSNRYNFREAVNWKHGMNFRTKYNFRYTVNQFREAKSQSGALGFALTHKLYENLSTSINTNASKTKQASNNIYQYDGGLNLRYKRRIPWGSIEGSAVHHYRLRSNEAEDSDRLVSGEPVTLQLGTVTFLNNRNVDTATIEVFDDSRVTRFQEGRDYEITSEDSFVRITCIAGGLIDQTPNCTDGVPVLVDYAFSTNPSSDILRQTRNYSVSVDLWDHLKISYSIHLSSSEALSGDSKGSLGRGESHSVNVGLRWRCCQSNFGYRTTKAVSSPHESWYARQSVVIRPHKRLHFKIRGNYAGTRFANSEDVVDVVGAGANMHIKLLQYGLLRFNLSWQEVSGSKQNIESLNFTSGYVIFFRKLRVSIDAGNRIEKSVSPDHEIKDYFVVLSAGVGM